MRASERLTHILAVLCLGFVFASCATPSGPLSTVESPLSSEDDEWDQVLPTRPPPPTDQDYHFEWTASTFQGHHTFSGSAFLCSNEGFYGRVWVSGQWEDGTILDLEGGFDTGHRHLPLVPLVETPPTTAPDVFFQIQLDVPLEGDGMGPKAHQGTFVDTLDLVFVAYEGSRTARISGGSTGTGIQTWIHPPEEGLPPTRERFSAVYPDVDVEAPLQQIDCED